VIDPRFGDVPPRAGTESPSDTQTWEIFRIQALLEHADGQLAARGAVPTRRWGEAAMNAAPLIAPLIPSSAARAVSGRTGTARRLPLAAVPEVPAVPGDVRYGFGRMDEWGRVADRAVSQVLGWQPGDRLILTASRAW
jgi:hypothetical protein